MKQLAWGGLRVCLKQNRSKHEPRTRTRTHVGSDPIHPYGWCFAADADLTPPAARRWMAER